MSLGETVLKSNCSQNFLNTAYNAEQTQTIPTKCLKLTEAFLN